MEYELLKQQLRLIVLLAQGHYLKASEIAARLDMQLRTVYRVLAFLPSVGLTLERRGSRYRIDPQSPLLDRLSEHLRFLPDEVATLQQLLDAVSDPSPQLRRLREKLARFNTGEVLQAHDVDEQLGRNINAIFESIRQERIVMLKGYSSGQRREKTDRLVEAYAFLPGNKEVRCFELTSRMNKTFNLTRVDEVELLDAPWRFATEHRPITTDLFHFSGEARHRVVLRLGRLAHNLLLEEVPAAEDLLQAEEGDTWLLDAEYCSMKGVGRFVLGLLDDIEVVDSPDFVDYLRAQLILFTNRLNAHPAALPHPVDE